jgi:hypothetical protein
VSTAVCFSGALHVVDNKIRPETWEAEWKVEWELEWEVEWELEWAVEEFR